MPIYEDTETQVQSDQELADALERQRLRDMAARLVEAVRAGKASALPREAQPFADTQLPSQPPATPDYNSLRDQLHNTTAPDINIGNGQPSEETQAYTATAPALKHPGLLRTLGDIFIGLGANPITSLIGQAGSALGLWPSVEEREIEMQQQARLQDAAAQWIRENTNYYTQPSTPRWYYEGIGKRSPEEGTMLGFATPSPEAGFNRAWVASTYGDPDLPSIVSLPGDTNSYIHEALHAYFAENFQSNRDKQTNFALDTIRFLGQDPTTLNQDEQKAWAVAKRWYDTAIQNPESYYGQLTELYAYLGSLATEKGLGAIPGQVRSNYADVFAF